MAPYTENDQLDLILNRLENATSRDEHDDEMEKLAELAPDHLEAIGKLYDSGSYDRHPLIWCLIGETTDPAIELFAKAIRDKDQYTRWAAAEALTRCATPAASAMLVAALKDRSHLVKQVAVRAMTLVRFRDPAAIPQLKKIVTSSHLQQHAPGMVALAKKALSVIPTR